MLNAPFNNETFETFKKYINNWKIIEFINCNYRSWWCYYGCCENSERKCHGSWSKGSAIRIGSK